MKTIIGKSRLNEFAKTFLINLKLNQKYKTTINIDNKNLILKEEFHITLLGNTLADELYKHLKNKKKQSQDQIEKSYIKIENKINQLILTAEISDGEKQKYFLLKKEYEDKEIRESIIQIIKINIYEEFFKYLEGAFGYYPKRGIPKCHITIYTKDKAIGLDTYKDFEKYKIKEIKF